MLQRMRTLGLQPSATVFWNNRQTRNYGHAKTSSIKEQHNTHSCLLSYSIEHLPDSKLHAMKEHTQREVQLSPGSSLRSALLRRQRARSSTRRRPVGLPPHQYTLHMVQADAPPAQQYDTGKPTPEKDVANSTLCPRRKL